MTREYRTAAAFKQALEQRLRTASTSGVDFARRRQLVVFDRFLARIALELGDTVTRARPNSRVNDLPDLALIATAGPVETGRLRAAIDQTFDFRGTHAVPDSLPTPPDTWEEPYATIAKEDQLRWPTLDEAFEAARAFLDPVLAGFTDSRWEPDAWSWVAPPAESDSESD